MLVNMIMKTDYELIGWDAGFGSKSNFIFFPSAVTRQPLCLPGQRGHSRGTPLRLHWRQTLGLVEPCLQFINCCQSCPFRYQIIMNGWVIRQELWLLARSLWYVLNYNWDKCLLGCCCLLTDSCCCTSIQTLWMMALWLHQRRLSGSMYCISERASAVGRNFLLKMTHSDFQRLMNLSEQFQAPPSPLLTQSC